MNAPGEKIQKLLPSQGVLATLDDLLAIPEEERYHELIEGRIYSKNGEATGEHGFAHWGLAAWLAPFGRRQAAKHPSGWRFVIGVDIYFDAQNTFRPAIAGWRRERMPEPPAGTPLRLIPDWVCEILSTNRSDDLVKKNRIYHRHQVPHYWIIDPVDRSLYVWRWTPEGYLQVQTAERGEIVNAEPFEVLPFSLDAVFGDEPEDETDEKNEIREESESKRE